MLPDQGIDIGAWVGVVQSSEDALEKGDTSPNFDFVACEV
jgi:hypothetical protein